MITALTLTPVSTSTPDVLSYQMPTSPPIVVRRRKRLRVTRIRPEVTVAIEGPWPVVASNATVAPRELTLDDEFDLVADETLAWAEANLPLAAETWTEE